MERKIIWKLNIVDLLILAIVAVSIIALIYKTTWGNRNSDTQRFTFTYVCQSSPMEVLQGVYSGDPCVDGDYGESLGVLIQADIFPVASVPGDSDENAAHPGPVGQAEANTGRATFTVLAEGKKGEHGVTVGDVLYLKGKSFNLIVGDSIFSVYIADIQEA